MAEKYSVLMSVYHKEKPEYLKTAMESMFQQTVPPDEFVLMCDGPLNDGLNTVIDELKKKHGAILRVIPLKENHGLGYVLQTGVKICKNSFIARMDSDDISRPDRCEKQLEVYKAHPEYSIVGSVIEEFSINPDVVDAKRVVPETNEVIVEFAKTRNPFNHPSVMYKKEDVLKAGNYLDVRFMQDYYLWVDMLTAGMKGYNIQEPLVRMRAGENLFKRRSGKQYIQIQIELFRKMRDAGFISQSQYIKSAAIRVCSAAAPNWMRKAVFETVLRKQ